jgi:hypothetical protein
MKGIRFFLAAAMVLSISLTAGAQEKRPSERSKAERNQTDLVEKIPQYKSVINWTTGEIVTEAEQPVSEVSPNLGKTVNRNEAEIRDELKLNLIKALGFIRISDIFQLKEYYSIKSDIRYEIMSKVDRAFYYPTVMAAGKFSGKVKMDLFGKDGIAPLFFRDIERAPRTATTIEEIIKRDNKKITEEYDGLILDTTLFPQFNPSIQFRIYNEDGDLLYGPETVNKDLLDKIGVCEYTTSLSNAFLSPRSGRRVFYAIPQDVKGRMNTYLVLKNQDADKLFKDPRTERSLNKSHVVIVKPLP